MKNIVVVIGGKGTSGKSTYISYVKEILGGDKCQEFSTIDPAKEIVLKMHEMEHAALLDSLNIETTSFWREHFNVNVPIHKEITEKTDAYRSLLHDIKMAWCEIDDGPNLITFCRVNDFFNRGGTVAFVNCREPDQIQHILDTLRKDKSEWTTISMNIVRNNTDLWTNEGDKTTDDFAYDTTIDNNGTLDDLRMYAEVFVEHYCI